MIYAIFQVVVIALVVAYSVVQLSRKLLPQTTATVQQLLVAMLQKRQWPLFVKRWGGKLQATPTAAAGCDAGCSTCNMCATGLTADQPVPIRIIQ